MSIVMGLISIERQITGEWIDTETGEVPADGSCRLIALACGSSLSVSAGEELEVALEATTGWRFVVEELRRVGARCISPSRRRRAARKGRRSARRTTARTPGICVSC